MLRWMSKGIGQYSGGLCEVAAIVVNSWWRSFGMLPWISQQLVLLYQAAMDIFWEVVAGLLKFFPVSVNSSA